MACLVCFAWLRLAGLVLSSFSCFLGLGVCLVVFPGLFGLFCLLVLALVVDGLSDVMTGFPPTCSTGSVDGLSTVDGLPDY